jgi:hypothetical protein
MPTIKQKVEGRGHLYFDDPADVSGTHVKLGVGGTVQADGWTRPAYYAIPYEAKFSVPAYGAVVIDERHYDVNSGNFTPRQTTVPYTDPIVPRPAGTYISVKNHDHGNTMVEADKDSDGGDT